MGTGFSEKAAHHILSFGHYYAKARFALLTLEQPRAVARDVYLQEYWHLPISPLFSYWEKLSPSEPIGKSADL